MPDHVSTSVAAARLHALDPRERERLAEIAELRIVDHLDGARASALDEVVEQVCALLAVPMSVVSIMLEDQQVFRARRGVDDPSTARDVSFCTHVVASAADLVVEDAAADPFFAGNPLVLDGVVSAYAGVPLLTSRRQVLGTLCAIDSEPRQFDGADLELLSALAARVVAELEAVRDRSRLEAIIDVPANLYRFEAFSQIVEIERRRHARSGMPMMLALFDDCRVLAEFEHALRPFDIAGHMEGEQVGVLLPDTSADAARRMFASACGRVEVVELGAVGRPRHRRFDDVGVAA